MKTKIHITGLQPSGIRNFWNQIAYKPYYDALKQLIAEDRIEIGYIFGLGGCEHFEDLPGTYIDVATYKFTEFPKIGENDIFLHINSELPRNSTEFSKYSMQPDDKQILKLSNNYKNGGLLLACDPILIPMNDDTISVGFHNLKSMKFSLVLESRTVDTTISRASLNPFEILYHDKFANLPKQSEIRIHECYGIYSNFGNRLTDLDLRRFVEHYSVFVNDGPKLSPEEYENNLRNAYFTLVPRPPYFKDSCSINRIYQALANGCIPVLLSEYDRNFLAPALNEIIPSVNDIENFDFETYQKWYEKLLKSEFYANVCEDNFENFKNSLFDMLVNYKLYKADDCKLNRSIKPTFEKQTKITELQQMVADFANIRLLYFSEVSKLDHLLYLQKCLTDAITAIYQNDEESYKQFLAKIFTSIMSFDMYADLDIVPKVINNVTIK